MSGGIRVVGSGAAPEPAGTGDAPDQGAGAAGAAEAGPGRRGPLLVVLALVALAGLAGTVGFGLAWRGLHDREAKRNDVVAVARQFTLALTNFDAKTVDADFDRIVSYATGDFLASAKQYFGSDVRKALQEKAASSRGQVRYLFTEDIHGNTADVFAVVDQTILNNSFKTPEADELRMDITLQKVSGVWRVSEVTVLQAPAVASPLAGATTTTAPAKP